MIPNLKSHQISGLQPTSINTGGNRMSSSLNLLALKAANQSKAIEEKQSSDRQRDSLILIQSHLLQLGYLQTAGQLQKEAGVNLLSRYERADNIDLMQIISEYEEFYQLKFSRKPKLSRRISAPISTTPSGQELRGNLKWSQPTASARTKRHSSSHSTLKPKETCHPRNNEAPSSKRLLPSIIGNNSSNQKSEDTKHDKMNERKSEISIQGAELDTQTNHSEQSSDTGESQNDRIVKPLPSFGDDFELRSLASSIQREIIDTSPQVQWNEIIELDNAKQLLKEAVIIPLKYPELFTGLLSPWRGILLYGAPGTGKVSTQSNVE